MKYLLVFVLAVMTSCNMMPFVVEEIEEAVEFEIDAIDHEIELREAHHNMAMTLNEWQIQIMEESERPINEDYFKYHFGLLTLTN